MKSLDEQVYTILHVRLKLPKVEVRVHAQTFTRQAKKALVADFDSEGENVALSEQKLAWVKRNYDKTYVYAMLEGYSPPYRDKPGQLLSLAINKLHPGATSALTLRTNSH